MFLRLLWESFVRQRRRKALAAIAILLGTTAVTAMLALATTIGDRIHRELAVYGANIVVMPKADTLDVKVGGEDLKPSTGGAYLKESDLEKLKEIFWANNITGVSPELSFAGMVEPTVYREFVPAQITGYRFGSAQAVNEGAPALHPWWKLQGRWPQDDVTDGYEAVLGTSLAKRLGVKVGGDIYLKRDGGRYVSLAQDPTHRPTVLFVVGIVTSGDATDSKILVDLAAAQDFLKMPGAIDHVDVAAQTRPEDTFARLDPDKLSPKQHDIWYCRPYANSIAYQIMEAIPGSRAEQVRRVEQSEGTVLSRISGLMWLVSGAALLAAGFAVSAAMATAVLERRGEIGLMRSLGASKGAIALLFYAESGLLAVAAGAVGFVAGSGLAFWLGGRIFPGATAEPVLNVVLLPVVLGLALVVAIAGSTPSIRAALKMDPSGVLRADA